jgi:hypothetical protein
MNPEYVFISKESIVIYFKAQLSEGRLKKATTNNSEYQVIRSRFELGTSRTEIYSVIHVLVPLVLCEESV